MKTRSFADLIVGVLAYVSLSGLAAIAAERPRASRPPVDERFALPPVKRRRRRSAEDACRHCKGSGRCEACEPATCRLCRGSGLQPRDVSLIPRLSELWDGR